MEALEQFRSTRDGIQFLLWDNHDDIHTDKDLPPENLIFVTDQCLFLLRDNHHWRINGTLKSAPNACHQLYTIHCIHWNGATPCVYLAAE